VPPTGGSSTASFFFDLGSPEAYLLAEQSMHVPDWIPVRLEPHAFMCAAEVDAYKEDVERRAAALGLMALRWPEPFPADTEFALLAATYARAIGRATAFALAAFRQAFAAGRNLEERDSVLIAAAACEMHPAAVLKGAELQSTRRALDEATERARAEGIRDEPALV